MPKDKAGKFHLNAQRAHAADKAAGGGESAAPLHSVEAPMGESEGAESASPVHEHLASMHAEMGGKHMHVHHDGAQITSHHVGEDGEVEGPHSHPHMDALKAHMDQFFNQEGREPSEHEY